MKKPRIFFNPIDGSAPLSATFSEAPKGDAVEANNELGVGFFSSSGELLGVTFDDVQETNDHQFLLFDSCQVDVWVKNGKAKAEIKENKSQASRKT